MKSRVYTSAVARRILLALAMVTLSLSVVSQSQAKAPGNMPGKPNIVVVSTGDHPARKINHAAVVRTQLLQVIATKARLDPKSIKVLSKGCGCTAVAPVEMTSFFDCMKGCLQDLGVSPVELIGCGAACAAAETGIGAIVCAICVGVNVTAIEFCAVGCAMKGGKVVGGFVEARTIKHRQGTSGSPQAQLRLSRSEASPD